MMASPLNGAARLTSWRGIPTPCLFLETVGGLPPFITIDHLEELDDVRGLMVTMSEFMTQTSAVAKSGSVSKYARIEKYLDFMVTRDPMKFPIAQNNDKGCSFDTHSGRKKISVTQFSEFMTALNPTVYAVLADEVEASCTKKRHTAAVYRSLKWLDLILGSSATNSGPNGSFAVESTAAAAAVSPSVSDTATSASCGQGVFAVVVGGPHAELRAHSARECAKRDVEGFCFGGFGLGEKASERPQLIAAAVAELPAEKPRVLVGLTQPLELLQAVESGIDVLCTAYPQMLSQQGFAAVFPLCPFQSPVVVPVAGANESGDGDGMKLNLRDRRLATDARPILPGCTCFTCTRHTRAYVNHLLNTREMLADVLLNTHNIHHCQQLLSAARKAISEGRLKEFIEAFQQQIYPEQL